MNKISIFIKYILSVIVCISMITGCVEEYEADLPESENRLLVVDGTIYSNQHSLFYLTWSTLLNEVADRDSSVTVKPFLGAKVTICGTDGTEYECKEEKSTEKRPKAGYYDYETGLYCYYNNEYGYYYYSSEMEYEEYDRSLGVYSCDVPKLNPDVSYFLTIKYGKDVYQSTPEKPISTPDIENLEYFQKDSLSNVEVLMTTAAPDNPDNTTYFTWDYSETWELRPTRTTTVYFDMLTKKITSEYWRPLFPKYGWKTKGSDSICIESTVHYAGGKLDKYQLVSIPRDDERISWNYSNIVTLRAISKAEYEYQMVSRQAGWEMGGLFTPQPSAIPTNIRCLTSSKKVVGYVGCSQNVVSKRMYIDGTKISRVLPESHIMTLYEGNEDDWVGMVYSGWLLSSYSKSIDVKTGLDIVDTNWAYAEDFDVRKRGASTVKPDYMPPLGEDYIFVDPGFNIYPKTEHKPDYYNEDYGNYEE